MSKGASGAAVFVVAVFSSVATAACAITHRSRWDRWRPADATRSGLAALPELRCASCERGVKGMTALPEQGATWPLGISMAFMLMHGTSRYEEVCRSNRTHAFPVWVCKMLQAGQTCCLDTMWSIE